jgi:hypothetical protein
MLLRALHDPWYGSGCAARWGHEQVGGSSSEIGVFGRDVVAVSWVVRVAPSLSRRRRVRWRRRSDFEGGNFAASPGWKVMNEIGNGRVLLNVSI